MMMIHAVYRGVTTYDYIIGKTRDEVPKSTPAPAAADTGVDGASPNRTNGDSATAREIELAAV
jgi:hypothetical protein